MTRKTAARTLVVDDEEGVRLFLEHVLTGLGCEVSGAATAGEAWERIEQDPGLDLILLDKNLPDRSGLDLLAQAKGHDPDLEIVMITGYASLDAAVTALRFGAGDFLTKPFDELAVLEGKLENALERARRARERTRLMADLEEREQTLEMEVRQRTAELQAALEELERKDAERRRLMANVGHDLRTPLTTIHGYLEMLLRGVPESEKAQRYLRTIVGQCQRLKRLTRDLGFLSRQADGRLEWTFRSVGTEDLLREAVQEIEPLFDQGNVRLSCSVEERTADIWGDRDRLMQVLTNLLGNAAKFAPEGTTVEVSAEADEEAVLISVADAGMGVPEEQRLAVFERFKTGDATGRGEGLGLSICRDIVEAHKGRIWVEESEQGGALFRLYLPASDRAAAITGTS
ncbi:MAG: ATP-binding protein [Myxococcota bacterium]